MSDIFVSYESSDRPRAEMLKSWLESAGWTTFIDGHIDLSEGFEERLERELSTARIVLVLWGAAARRSEWVLREAARGLDNGRLLQIHATALPIPGPFDKLQAVRMQSWAGEAVHSERAKLLSAVASRLGVPGPIAEPAESPLVFPAVNFDAQALVENVFQYCASRLESQRLLRSGQPVPERVWAELRLAFDEILRTVVPQDEGPLDDREGVVHRMIDGFHEQLELLAPNPNLMH